MTFKSLLWNIAVFSGWFAVIAHGLAWHARRSFKALLKAPLTDEVEHMTQVREWQITCWTAIGLFQSGFSVLCFVLWRVQ